MSHGHSKPTGPPATVGGLIRGFIGVISIILCILTSFIIVGVNVKKNREAKQIREAAQFTLPVQRVGKPVPHRRQRRMTQIQTVAI